MGGCRPFPHDRWKTPPGPRATFCIVSELSRLGRSLGQILDIIDRLIHKGVRLVSIKEAIRFEGKQNLQTKAMIVLFGLFAEIERDLIVERTKEGLAAARARGKRLGRQGGLVMGACQYSLLSVHGGMGRESRKHSLVFENWVFGIGSLPPPNILT